MPASYLETYPQTTQSMTTAELIMEASRLENLAAVNGGLVGFNDVRYNLVKRELVNRKHY